MSLLREFARVQFVRGVRRTNTRACLVQMSDQRGNCLVDRPAMKELSVSETVSSLTIHGVVEIWTFSLRIFPFVSVARCFHLRVEYAISSFLYFPRPPMTQTWHGLLTSLWDEQSNPGRAPCNRPAHRWCQRVPPTDHAHEEGRSSGETRFFQGMSWAERADRTGSGRSEKCHEPGRARPTFSKM